MILLTTSAIAQAISVIPRTYTSNFTMTVRDDSTNVTKSYDIGNAVTSGNYLNYNHIFNPILVENHFYDLHLYVDYNFWNTNYSFWNLNEEIWNIESSQTEDIFKDRLKKLVWTNPSWTIIAHIGMDGYMYIHPEELRTLSVREAARIQSFPDDFIFLGNQQQVYVQVGNAVPPLLSYVLAKAVRRTIS